MDILQAIVLGIIQGLTEFIPVSSSGHLAIVPYLFGWETPSIIFDIALHTGTLIALLVFFRKKIIDLAKNIYKLIKKQDLDKKDIANFKIYRNVLLATVPAAMVGFILRDVISIVYKSEDAESLRVSIIYTAIALIVVGVAFLISDWIGRKKFIELHRLGYIGAVIIGFAQAVALFRGVSRSGITLLTGQLLGLKRVDAAEFSFLMSIPILILTTAYGFYELLSLDAAEMQSEMTFAIVGALAAALSGFVAIDYMLRFLRKNGLWQFGIYRIMLGVFVLVLIV